MHNSDHDKLLIIFMQLSTTLQQRCQSMATVNGILVKLMKSQRRIRIYRCTHIDEHKLVILPNSFSWALDNTSLYSASASRYLPCFRYAEA